jgi:hypothetical protein
MGRADGGFKGITKIVDNGPDGTRWDLLVFAEGYQVGDLGTGRKFDQDVRALIADLARISPFDEFTTAVNVFRVDTWSTDKGAWMPPPCGPASAPKKTLFDSRFCHNGRKEYLTVDTDWVKEFAANVYPKYEALVVLVNEDEYGGSGDGNVAVCTRKPSTRKLVAHELGHAAFDLADEYEGPGTHPAVEPLAANVTVETIAANLKWKSLLTPGAPVPTTRNAVCGACLTTSLPANTVGAFEGGRTRECNVYRPSVNCRMRDWNSQFGKPCKAEIRARLTPFLP